MKRRGFLRALVLLLVRGIGQSHRIRGSLALLRNLDLGLHNLAALDKLTQKRTCLSGRDVDALTDDAGDDRLGLLGQELHDGSLDRLIGDSGLAGLGGSLARFVARVHLGNLFSSELGQRGIKGSVGSDGGKELSISHNIPLSLFGVGRHPILEVFLSLSVISISQI